jgi:hypothetical protein
LNVDDKKLIVLELGPHRHKLFRSDKRML